VPRRPTKTPSRLSRDEWIRAALTAIADGGLVAVNVQQLATALGVTTGSFYWHFASRDEIIEAALDRWEQERIDRLEEMRAIADPRERLQTLVRAIYVNRERGELFASLQASASDPRIRNRLRRTMQRRLTFLTQTYRDLGYPIERARHAGRVVHSLYSGLWEVIRMLPPSDEHALNGERLTDYVQYLLDIIVPPTTGKADP
jgi:AcrR family transcriptional regulator